MVSIVSTSTVTTTTTTTAGLISVANIMGIIATVCLIGMLATKELVSANTSITGRAISRAMNIAIVPFILVFSLVVVVKLVEILG